MSTVVNKIDAKGRVSVPAAFRNVVKDEGGVSVVLFPSFTDQAIEGCTLNQMSILGDVIDQLPPFSEERDALAASILGSSHDLGFDSEGRIKLPEELVSHAALEGEAMFIGLGKKFQIWSPALRQATEVRRQELARANRAQLSFNPQGGQ